MRPYVNKPGELRGGHVLAAMLAFFGIVIAINIAFSVIAVRTFPGEDEPHSYLQGLHYNETLAARAAQTALGWRAAVRIVRGREAVALDLHLADSAGAPLDGMVVTGVLRRPATARDDHDLTFTPIGGGGYRAEISGFAEGSWTVQGVARRGDQRFDFERRMTWRQPRTR